MKSELRLRHHLTREGGYAIEVWYKGDFIGTVVGADGPGVRIVSKYTLRTDFVPMIGMSILTPSTIDIRILATPDA